MLKSLGIVAALILSLLSGLALIELSITDPDYELANRIFGIVCGLILAAPPVLILISVVSGRGKGETRFSLKGLLGAVFSGVKEDITPDQTAAGDHSETGTLLRRFREDYNAFFTRYGPEENAPLQADVTQIFRHILLLQKKRLEFKGISLRMEAERRQYGTVPPLRKSECFDGKYEITDISETIEASRTFSADGRQLAMERSRDTAIYRLINARQKGESFVICPNCGAETTRTNLMDGCDFCGTQFTVEDLGLRVSEFALRPDYEVEYARYTDARGKYNLRVGLIVGIPFCILSLIGMLSACADGGLDAGPVLSATAVFLGTALCTGAAVFFGQLLFWMFVFPAIQLKASLTMLGKRQLKKMRESMNRDEHLEREIRRRDPLFSLAGFFSNVQNKLAAVHFSDHPAAACAFSEGERAEAQITVILPEYADVIDMSVESIALTDYRRGSDLQEAGVSATLRLLEERDGRVSRRREQLRLRLIKSAACTTQEICGPSFLKCPGCGASLSLPEGRRCAYCGSERRLSDSDWAIADYTITG